MKSIIKIPRQLLGAMREDLARPHPHAFERVGFVSAGFTFSNGTLWVLARGYRPVADEDYLRDRTVGAMMGPEAIRKALQWAMRDRVGTFHVHGHHGCGIPGFSHVDLREQGRYVPNFFQVAPQNAHGALVLSDDSFFGRIWLNAEDPGEAITAFVDVGSPLKNWTSYESI